MVLDAACEFAIDTQQYFDVLRIPTGGHRHETITGAHEPSLGHYSRPYRMSPLSKTKSGKLGHSLALVGRKQQWSGVARPPLRHARWPSRIVRTPLFVDPNRNIIVVTRITPLNTTVFPLFGAAVAL